MEEGITFSANTGLSYAETLPPGYLFAPTDYELVHHFLMNKILNPSLSFEEIHEINIYNYSPECLTAIYELNRATEWYFFSPRSKKYMNGSRPNRSAGDGFWRASAKCKNIYDPYGQKVEGRKRTLVFHRGMPQPRGNSHKTNWMMHEYVLADTNLPQQDMRNDQDGTMLLNEYVLCKIYKKREHKNSNPAEENANQLADQRLKDHGFKNGVFINAHENNNTNNSNILNSPINAQLNIPLPNSACAMCNLCSNLNSIYKGSSKQQIPELVGLMRNKCNYHNVPMDPSLAMNGQNQGPMVAANGGAQFSFCDPEIFEDLPDLYTTFDQNFNS